MLIMDDQWWPGMTSDIILILTLFYENVKCQICGIINEIFQSGPVLKTNITSSLAAHN